MDEKKVKKGLIEIKELICNNKYLNTPEDLTFSDILHIVNDLLNEDGVG